MRSAVRILQDWHNASLSETVHPNLDGSLETLRDNLLTNQYLTERDKDGSVSGVEFSGFSKAAGRVVVVGKTPSTMTIQTPYPLESDAQSWEIADRLITGQKPIVSPSDPDSSPLGQSGPVSVSTRADGEAGFAGGVRLYAYTLSLGRKNRLETGPSEPVEFTNEPGRGIRVTLPDPSSVPAQGVVNHYISDAVPIGQTPDPSTLRFQGATGGFSNGKAARGKTTDDLPGPYRSDGRKPPKRNQTYIGKPRELRKRRDLEIAPGNFDLQSVDVRFAYSYRTPLGESELSPWSDAYYRRRKNLPIRKGTAIYIDPPPKRIGTTHFYLYALMDGQVYSIRQVLSGRRYYPFDRGSIPFFGYAEEAPGGLTHVLAQGEGPEEDTSGIPDPAQAAEPPVGYGRASLAAGAYYVADALVDEEGKLGIMSPPQKVNLTTGRVVRVNFASRTNGIPNAEFGQLDKNNQPIDHTVTGAGITPVAKDGEYTLSTGGPRTDSLFYVGPSVDVNTSEPMCIAGEILAVVRQGSVELLLQQLDNAGNVIPTGNVTVASMTGTGLIKVTDESWGPGGKRAFAAKTASVRYIARTPAGQTNDVTYTLRNLGIFPNMLEPPRKVGEDEDGNPTFDAPYSTSYPEDAVAVVASPPTIPPAPEDEPVYLARADFENNSFTQPGWTIQAAPPAPSYAVTEAAAIGSLYGLNVNSPQGGGEKNLYYLSDIPGSELVSSGANGESLALAGRIRLKRLPTGRNESVRVMEIGDSGDGPLAYLLLYNNGNLVIFPQERNSGIFYNMTNVATSVNLSDEVYVEIICTGVGTDKGEVRVLAGANGAQREEVTKGIGIDWRFRSAEYARFGVFNKSNPNSGLNLDFDRFTVTPRGAPLSEQAPPPLGVAFPDPDRPKDANGEFIELDPNGDPIEQLYVFVPPGSKKQGFLRTNPIGVIPGVNYASGIYSRHTSFGDGCQLEVVSSTREVLVAESGKEPWAENQVSVTGGEQLSIEKSGFPSGVFVYQLPAVSRGAEVKRGFGRAASGTASVILPAKTTGEPPYGTIKDMGISTPGVVFDSIEVGNVTDTWRSSDELLGFGAESDSASVVPKRYLEANLSISGDALIPSGGVYVDVRRTLPEFVRADRSQLYGGTIANIGGLFEAFSRPDYSIQRPGGRRKATPLTDDIKRLPDFEVFVTSQTAWTELREDCMDLDWGMDIVPPFSLVPIFYRLRLPDIPEFEVIDMPVRIYGQDVYAFGKMKVKEDSEVLESANISTEVRRYA